MSQRHQALFMILSTGMLLGANSAFRSAMVDNVRTRAVSTCTHSQQVSGAVTLALAAVTQCVLAKEPSESRGNNHGDGGGDFRVHGFLQDYVTFWNGRQTPTCVISC